MLTNEQNFLLARRDKKAVVSCAIVMLTLCNDVCNGMKL